MHELLTTAEMGEADRLAVAGGIPARELMERAGAAVAAAAARLARPGSPTLVVAGPGNNGGDGYVAARRLAERGWTVQVLTVGVPRQGEAAEAASLWTGETVPASGQALSGAGLVVDAMFGAGLVRPVTGAAAAVVAAVNQAECPVLAVDLPSGIDGDSGAVLGCAVEADATVTFFRRKPGHLLLPGRTHAGRVQVVDIGIPDTVLARIGVRTFHNSPALWRIPSPSEAGHKYSRGHAVVLSGGIASTGAARLAARAALRAGAGLVTLATPREALAVQAAANLAVMVRVTDSPQTFAGLLEDRRINAIVLGPGAGVGERLCEMVEVAAESDAGLVLDADAITSFRGDPERLRQSIRTRQTPVVLTPHEGEFTRYFKSIKGISKANSKLEKTRAAAEYLDQIIILKGADTVVAAPDGRAAIADNAPPWLATAGAGDVLAGIVAGLLAQGVPGFEAACAAVWWHGAAAAKLGSGLIAEDLPDVLPACRITGGAGAP